MTDISAITSAASAGAMSSIAGSKTMGKEDFLQLLVAQLQNQDPLSPDDPTEFVAQLAQFSSLEQQFTMNENLGKIVASSADVERMTAMTLIGKMVAGQSSSFKMAPYGDEQLADRLGFTPGEIDGKLGYSLEEPASKVTINIMNESGVLVASLKDVNMAAGEHKIDWPGKDNAGNPLPAGKYSMRIKATGIDAEGAEVELKPSPFVMSTVTGVELGASGSMLVTSAGMVPLADVTSVVGQ